MRSRAAFIAMLILIIGLPACGKYGPPVRTVVPEERPARRRAIEQEPQAPAVPAVPEEKIPEPAEFDDAETNEEEGP
jgi:hypothetical protein